MRFLLDAARVGSPGRLQADGHKVTERSRQGTPGWGRRPVFAREGKAPGAALGTLGRATLALLRFLEGPPMNRTVVAFLFAARSAAALAQLSSFQERIMRKQ